MKGASVNKGHLKRIMSNHGLHLCWYADCVLASNCFFRQRVLGHGLSAAALTILRAHDYTHMFHIHSPQSNNRRCLHEIQTWIYVPPVELLRFCHHIAENLSAVRSLTLQLKPFTWFCSINTASYCVICVCLLPPTGHCNNIHCLAKAINQIAAALFTIHKGSIEDRLKEFLAVRKTQLVLFFSVQCVFLHMTALGFLISRVSLVPFSLDLVEKC